MARKKKKQAKVVNTSGKRKTAIARATVKAGQGRVRLNSEPIEILRPDLARNKAMEPLTIAGAMNRLAAVDINVNTTGGGQMGQLLLRGAALGRRINGIFVAQLIQVEAAGIGDLDRVGDGRRPG